MRRIDHKIAYLLVLVVFIGAGSTFAAKYIIKTKNDTAALTQVVVNEVVPAVSEAVKEQIIQEPPKLATKPVVTTKTVTEGKVTTVANANLGIGDVNGYLSSCKSSAVPSGISFTDKTGRYPTLGATLLEYLNRLRWGGEMSSLCGVYVMDAGDTGWSGQYLESYTTSNSGHILNETGAIILNASDYSSLDQNTFIAYMKLILSHEYGHHYTQYHKLVDLNSPVSDRFPDAYYSVRPLSKSATVADCSVSWESCDAEIIAEDYSYFYSGFSLHQMYKAFGYPSTGTRTWLDSLTNATSPTPEPEPTNTNQNQTHVPTNTNTNVTTNSNENANTNTNVNTNSGSLDTTNPVVTITDPKTNPYNWTSYVPSLIIKVRASDNIAVTKIKVYINGQFQGEASYAGVDLTWPYTNAPVGTYMLKAEAYDAAGNMSETTLTINKN